MSKTFLKEQFKKEKTLIHPVQAKMRNGSTFEMKKHSHIFSYKWFLKDSSVRWVFFINPCNQQDKTKIIIFLDFASECNETGKDFVHITQSKSPHCEYFMCGKNILVFL
jgi:hypothetical protein